MTLRARLSLAFVLVVLLPVTLGVIALRGTTSDAVADRDMKRLTGMSALVTGYLQATCARVQAAAETAARAAYDESPQAAVERIIAAGTVPWVEIRDGAGEVVATGGTEVTGEGPEIGDCGGTDVPASGALSYRVPLQTQTDEVLFTATAGVPLDQAFVDELAAQAGVDVALLAGGEPVAASVRAGERTALVEAAAEAPDDGRAVSVGSRVVSARGVDRPGLTVVTAADDPGPSWPAGAGVVPWLVILATVGLAALIGWLLARATARPLAELGDAAARVAAGDLETRIPVRSRDEVGRLANAFNGMTGELRTYVRALEDSRDELRNNLARLGDTLSSTHDLNRILAVILETAMTSVQARAGAVLLVAPGRHELYLKVSRGLEGRGVDNTFRLPIGVGVSGTVADTGEPVRGRLSQLSPADVEPDATSVISVPLKSSGRVLGVLDLYDRVDAEEFDDSDLATIRTFASQATVAIDNVLLHQEAQRLSITDGLTGLWNYRYFSMNFGKEIERAARFSRPLSLLMLDLDRFKSVNDEFGHQRGDAILIEMASRIRGEIREVDTLARYGGEELVLVLPETDAVGAQGAAERICEVVRRQPFGGDGHEPLRVTLSIGVAVFPEHGTLASTLLRQADEALYAAKRAGRDTWRMASVVDGLDPVAVSPPAPPSGAAG